MFEPLTEGDVRKWGNLLYPLFIERCGVHMYRAVDAIGSGNLAASPERLLRLLGRSMRVHDKIFDLGGGC
jgi:GntR family transcriptional regulator